MRLGSTGRGAWQCDIGDILEAPLNLEGHGTRLDEFLEVGRLVEVLQRQQVALVLEFVAIGIEEVELHAAHLCAGTTVGRTPKAVLRGIAESAIADAEGSMDEDLQFDVGNVAVDGGNLVDRQFACQDDTTEP